MLTLNYCAKADGDGELGLGRAQLTVHEVLDQNRQLAFFLFRRLLLTLSLLVELDDLSSRQLDSGHVLRSNILPVIFDEVGLSLEASLVVPLEAAPRLLDRVSVDLYASHPPDVSDEEIEGADFETVFATDVDKDFPVICLVEIELKSLLQVVHLEANVYIIVRIGHYQSEF